MYIQTHAMPSRACQGSHPAHFQPVDPGLHTHCPVRGSQGSGSEPCGWHSHSWQDPPGIFGFPVYPGEHLEIEKCSKKEL